MAGIELTVKDVKTTEGNPNISVLLEGIGSGVISAIAENMGLKIRPDKKGKKIVGYSIGESRIFGLGFNQHLYLSIVGIDNKYRLKGEAGEVACFLDQAKHYGNVNYEGNAEEQINTVLLQYLS